MASSPSTILRLVRSHGAGTHPTPRVVGVDDFALRRGQTYGTLLVDGETHRPVDILPERRADTLAYWLETHPGVQIITRDRSTEYARGAGQGAPTALQVADRWHLLLNLREALERLLDRCRPQLSHNHAAMESAQPLIAPPTRYDRARRCGTKDRLQQLSSQARRYARYTQVKALQAQGRNILQIAHALKLSRQTVRKYLRADTFPASPPLKRQKSILDPYVDYLQERWDAGCHNSRQLWRDIRHQGFPGSLRMVWLWVALRRERLGAGRPPARHVQIPFPTGRPVSTLPASRRLVWLLFLPLSKLGANQQFLQHTLRQVPELDLAFVLTQQFLTLVRQRQADALLSWLDAWRASGLSELASFAQGLRREFASIYLALEMPYSNGVTEGHINRLKTIKRSMYGRANFDRLRLRVLSSV